MDRIQQHIRRLHALLRRHGRSRDDADDLIQEALLRMHVYCKGEDKPDAFVNRTVLNLSVDMHRKERRYLYASESVEQLVVADARPSLDEDFAAVERLTKASRVLDGLGSRTREIFIMHRVEGHGCAHIAQHFGISLSAVEKHIARAVLALMDVVESE